MKSINVEITMGHNIGITASYYKPNEIEILDDYLKAVDLLTFSQNDKILEKKVKELEEQNKNIDYIIKGKNCRKKMNRSNLIKPIFINEGHGQSNS
jgi:hypothetical protein